MRRLLMLLAAGSMSLLLVSCGSFGQKLSYEHVRTVAVVSTCDEVVRYHQGITAFDNVRREEPAGELKGALTAAVTRGLASRFEISKVAVPAAYTAKGVGFWNKKPPLPSVPGVDAVAVISPWIAGQSEPAIAMQGFGIATARVLGKPYAYATVSVMIYDAKTTKPVTAVLISEREETPGVQWHTNWSEYSAAERAAIREGLLKVFGKAEGKVREKYAR